MTDTTPEAVIDAIGEVIRCAFWLADSTEDDGERLTVERADFDNLSAALDALDEWPDEPGIVCGPAAKAQWAIKILIAQAITLGRDKKFADRIAARLAALAQEGESND